MGCHNSKGRRESGRASQSSATISKDSKKIVQDMWFALRPDIKHFGISIFVRLFDEAPETQDLFYDFKDLKNQDELLQSLKELDHVARVMSAFGNCIELLNDMEQFASTAEGLGKAHRKIGIRPEHLGVFGRIVMSLLSEYCQSSWTIKKEKAWKELFVVLNQYFATGLAETTTTTTTDTTTTTTTTTTTNNNNNNNNNKSSSNN